MTTFNNAFPADTNEMNASFATCLEALRNSIFPHRAVLMQKRYLCRFVCKPATIKTQEFVAHLIEINSYLPKFPPTTTGGEEPASLPDDELIDILEFGMPNIRGRNKWCYKILTHYSTLLKILWSSASVWNRLKLMKEQKSRLCQ